MKQSGERCGFRTTKPLGALSQSARGGTARYAQCRNKATTTVTVTDANLSWSREREIAACGLHARLHEERGYMP